MDKDLEKGIQEATSAPDAQIPPMAGGEEKKLLIPDLHDPTVTGRHHCCCQHEPCKKKSLKCWLVVTASVMILTNHIQSAQKYQLIPLEPVVIFTMFICAIFLVFRTMKQM